MNDLIMRLYDGELYLSEEIIPLDEDYRENSKENGTGTGVFQNYPVTRSLHPEQTKASMEQLKALQLPIPVRTVSQKKKQRER